MTSYVTSNPDEVCEFIQTLLEVSISSIDSSSISNTMYRVCFRITMVQRKFEIPEDEAEPPRFIIEGEIQRRYQRFNAVGKQLTVQVLSPHVGGDTNPVSHFLATVTDLVGYAVRNRSDSDMVGITIRNQVNLQHRAIGISFRRRDQLSENVIWSVFEKVAQSNDRFNALDNLIVEVHSIMMPVGFGKVAMKTKGRSLSVMAHWKRSIVEVKAEENCLAHALVIAVAKLTNDSNYKAFRQGRKIRPKVDHLLEITGIDLTNGRGIPELTRFQELFIDYRIVVYGGLHCDEIIFDGRIESENRINLLYDDRKRHYHVIVNLTGAMAKTYVCKGCNKGCERDVEHRCQQTCSDCNSIPPCITSQVRMPCAICNRTFRSQTCNDRHTTNKLRGKTVCAQKRNCAKCGALLTRKRHECFKPYCEYCGEKQRSRSSVLYETFDEYIA